MLLTGWLPDTNKRAEDEGEPVSADAWFVLLASDLSDGDPIAVSAERICLSTLDMDLSCG